MKPEEAINYEDEWRLSVEREKRLEAQLKHERALWIIERTDLAQRIRDLEKELETDPLVMKIEELHSELSDLRFEIRTRAKRAA